MENRINDDLSLSSSDKEYDSECDNESDKGSEVSLIINFLRINFYYMDSNSLLPHFGHTLLDIICLSETYFDFKVIDNKLLKSIQKYGKQLAV